MLKMSRLAIKTQLIYKAVTRAAEGRPQGLGEIGEGVRDCSSVLAAEMGYSRSGDSD